MQTLQETEFPLYIASIRFLDGPNPETHKDALIEPLCSAYQDLTQLVFEFSILLLRRLTITRSSRVFEAARVVESNQSLEERT
jgi:hypothetical protein